RFDAFLSRWIAQGVREQGQCAHSSIRFDLHAVAQLDPSLNGDPPEAIGRLLTSLGHPGAQRSGHFAGAALKAWGFLSPLAFQMVRSITGSLRIPRRGLCTLRPRVTPSLAPL